MSHPQSFIGRVLEILDDGDDALIARTERSFSGTDPQDMVRLDTWVADVLQPQVPRDEHDDLGLRAALASIFAMGVHVGREHRRRYPSGDLPT